MPVLGCFGDRDVHAPTSVDAKSAAGWSRRSFAGLGPIWGRSAHAVGSWAGVGLGQIRRRSAHAVGSMLGRSALDLGPFASDGRRSSVASESIRVDCRSIRGNIGPVEGRCCVVPRMTSGSIWGCRNSIRVCTSCGRTLCNDARLCYKRRSWMHSASRTTLRLRRGSSDVAHKLGGSDKLGGSAEHIERQEDDARLASGSQPQAHTVPSMIGVLCAVRKFARGSQSCLRVPF